MPNPVKSFGHFFRTTTGIQSESDVFNKERFILTFFTILEVTEILFSFRLVLEVFSKQFCFIRCRRGHLWAIEQRRYSRFTFVENTIGNLPKVLGVNFLGSDGLFCFISICKFGSFKNPFATITSRSELYFRFRRFTLLVKTKKVISMKTS